MEWHSSADLMRWAGLTVRQLHAWRACGCLPSRYMLRTTGTVGPVGGSGYTLVFDALDLSVARALAEAQRATSSRGLDRYAEIAEALRSLPLDQWPGRTLVVSATGASIDGPIGPAALVVDLGACAYPEGDGLAAVV